MGITGTKTAATFTLAAVLALTACGGNSDEVNTVTEDTDLLLQNAARHTSENVGINLNSMSSTANRSTVRETLFKVRKASSTDRNQLRSDAAYEEQAHDYILPTLTGGNASHTRNGNTITIDPDEQYVCTQWFGNDNAEDINSCNAVLSDLIVQINATSDDTGTLRYVYAGENLIVIQYAPASASYELFLPALNNVLQRAGDIIGDADSLPETMAGALKLTTRIDNATAGQEAGNLSFSVTQPVEIANSNERYSFTLDRSVLFDITSDAATGDGSVSLDIKSLYFAINEYLGTEASALTTVEMPDFTMSADLTNSGTQVLFSNFGMGRGPLKIENSGSPVVSISLDKFSARYNDLTRHAEFLSSMSLDVAIDYTQAAFGWLGDESTLRLLASIPSGTELSRQFNGSVKVDTGGPVNYRYAYIDGSGRGRDFQQDVLFTAGQCFDESYDNDGLDLVSCN